uniref:L1 transposable element RRM domain-containing protein n=1 Tax=Latimeria chalumnae TaxID=7897 RepID=H3A568_LATCH
NDREKILKIYVEKNNFELLTSSLESRSESRPSSPASVELAATSMSSSGDMPTDVKNILTLLNNMLASLSEIKETNANLLQRMVVAEQQIVDMGDEQCKMADNTRDLQKQIEALRIRIDDQENCSQRNNLRMVGFPENVEQGKPIKFLLETLPGLLKLSDDVILDIKRAHRSLVPKPSEGQISRPFIVKFLLFQVKERRQQASWARYNGRIQIFPDLFRNLQERRWKFFSVKQRIKGLGLKYGLFFPAVLRVTVEGETKSFSTPQEVELFIKK